MARWDRVKDFRNLLDAFAALSIDRDNAYRVLCGPSLTEKNRDLLKLVSECGVDIDKVRLLGFQSKIPEIMSFIDAMAEGYLNVWESVVRS